MIKILEKIYFSTKNNKVLFLNNAQTKNLSIVIPSLGGSKLENTLNFIHNMKIRPKETIICIPRSYKKK